jgi:polyisoprenoid-binding protein YceI
MKVRLLTVFIALLFAELTLAADTYAIDPGHSRVEFTARHLLISKVNGFFNLFSATIQFDEKDPSQCSLSGSIQTASIDTNNTNRDADLRSASWFDVEKHPQITFQSKKVEKKGDGYQITGVLTIRGVSKEISFPASVTGPVEDPWGSTRIGVEATLSLDRREFQLLWDKRMDNGGLVVSNEIEIQLAGEAIKK